MAESLAYSLHKLVLEMDRAADRVLRESFGISYKRAYFLFTLRRVGPVSQHDLATALGYSDPAVSTMVLELKKAGFVTVTKSPEHGRKRLVALTPRTEAQVREGMKLMDAHFSRVVARAKIDVREYRDATRKLYKVIAAKEERES